MKTFTLCVMLYLGATACSTCQAQNQDIKVCVFCANNLSEQPSWGPAGYRYVYYYYIPEIDVYYSVPQHQFIYQSRGAWVVSQTLPLRYAAFDFYKAYKAVINNYEPYLQHDEVKATYASFKSRRNMPVNRDDENFKKARETDHDKARGRQASAFIQ